MKVNTNIKLKDRSSVTLKDFKGLDTLSSPVEVSSIHGTEVENLISRDGVNHKRYGWQAKWKLNYAIKGIFNFKLGNYTAIIAYVKTTSDYKFYVLNSDGTTSPLKVEASFKSDTCKCFVNGEKAYFVGFGDFLVLTITNGNYVLKRIIEDNPYIPTTTENIGSEEKGQHYTRITAEERNILSKYAYNTLFGESLENSEVSTYHLDTLNFTNLEVEVNYEDEEPIVLKPTENEKAIILTTGMKVDKNFSIDLRNTIINVTGDGLRGSGDTKELNLPPIYKLIEFENGNYIALFFKQTVDVNSTANSVEGKYCITTEVKARIVLYDKYNNELNEYDFSNNLDDYKEVTFNINPFTENGNFKTAWTFSFEGWEILKFNTIGAVDFYNNIKDSIIKKVYRGEFLGAEELVLADSTGEYSGHYNSSEGIIRLYYVKNDKNAYKPKIEGKPNIRVKIELPNFNEKQVTEATNGIKFGLGGSDDRLFLVNENVVMWSKDEDFTYFGEKSWCLCGTKDTKIKGLDRLNDSTLLLAKEYSVREPSIYVISGVLSEGQTEGGTIDYTAVFSPRGYQVGMGAVGELTNFNGDCLMVCKDGVYSVALGENMTVDARYIHHRSRQITNELSKYDLSKAKCIACDGKYYLAIDGKCFVADNKYLASFKGDMQNVPNYEWWKWTNMPVSVWGYIDNKLCFGTNDGEICVFTDKFYDERQSAKNITSGQATYKIVNGEIVGFTFSSSVTVPEVATLIMNSDFYGKVETNKFDIIDGKTRFYVPLNDIYGTTIYFDKYGNGGGKEITKEETYFEVDYVPEITANNTVIYYQNFKGVTLGLTKKSNYYALVYNGKELIGAPATRINPSQVNAVIRVPIRMPITAKWITGALDLGSRTYSKTLTMLTLTGEKDLANHLKYGIRTRITNRNYEFLRANNDLDFDNLDLDTISLDSQFASSFVKKLNLRNVNFIQLYLVSDTEEDMAINSIQIEFKVCKKNIGVN